MTPRRSARDDATVHSVPISHPDRVIFPEAGLTKLDLARYFDSVAKVMLPHVAHRPLVLVRCPTGSAETCFYQKHWTGHLPDALDTVPIRQSDGLRRYVVVHDAEGLVTLAQWGVIEVHPWGARADDPERPDRITFDLDPGPGVAWPRVLEGARRLRRTLRERALDSWLKTTGGKGLHVVVPIDRRSTWDEVSGFARSIAEQLHAESPEEYISVASKAKRRGVIFIDWLRNTRGATSVAAWCPRARPNAGVSVPIPWTRLAAIRRGDQFTITTVGRHPPRSDPWKSMLASRQSLPKK
ncbi:MAG: non-homologous end-joining DNA ligase [Gemmatimonadales bacterium]